MGPILTKGRGSKRQNPTANTKDENYHASNSFSLETTSSSSRIHELKIFETLTNLLEYTASP